MKEKVSIVIPVYNGSNYLDQSIESALSQTYKNIEVIVVNDGSIDGGATRRVAERYGNRIRYFEKQNGGVASALNFAVDKMAGDFFSWLSHDDLYLVDKIEAQMNHLGKLPSEERVIVYSDFAVFSDDSMERKVIGVPDVAPMSFRHLLTSSSAVHGCTLLIPRSAFRLNRFDEAKRFTQDYDMWFRLAAEFDFVKLDRPLVLARQHSLQDSVRRRRESRIEKNEMYSRFVSELTEKDVDGTGGRGPMAYINLASGFARSGLARAALVAARKSISNMRLENISASVVVASRLAWVSVFLIPFGFVKSRVGDAVKRRGILCT